VYLKKGKIHILLFRNFDMPPIVIEPPDERQRAYKPGDEIHCRVVLIGRAAIYKKDSGTISELLLDVGKCLHRTRLLPRVFRFVCIHRRLPATACAAGVTAVISRPATESPSYQLTYAMSCPGGF
jgi:hypothetical protein